MTRTRKRNSTGKFETSDESRRIQKLERQISQMKNDGALYNSLSGLGVPGFDPRASTEIIPGQELDKSQIDNLMRWEYGCNKFVYGLPDAAVRKWIRVEAEGVKKDASKAIIDRLEAWGVREAVRMGLILERQYGGSAVLIGADDGQPMEAELDPKAIKAIHYLQPISCYRLNVPGSHDLDADPASPRFGMPLFYTLNRTDIPGEAQKRIHWTRMLIFQGWCPHERERRYDWGVSVLEGFWPTWRDYEASISHGLGMQTRMNETRLKIGGLLQLMKGGQWDTIRANIQEIASIRSVFRILMVDKEDDVEDAALSMSGVSDMVKIARENVAAASGLSLQNFFGLAREGMSDNDESGSQRDDAAVAAYQRDRLLQPINRMVDLAIVFEKLRVKKYQVRFLPLREETPAELAQRRLTEAQSAEVAVTGKWVHQDEVREGMRSDPEVPYPLQDGSVEEAFGVQPAPGQPVDPETGEPVLPEPPKDPKDEEEESAGGDTRPPFSRGDGDWDESKHPRGTDGKFGSGSSSSLGEPIDSDRPMSDAELEELDAEIDRRVEAGTRQIEGITWQPIRIAAEAGAEVVDTDLEKLMTNLAQRPGSFVGPGGKGEIEGRIGRATDFIRKAKQSGDPVDMPQLGLERGGHAHVTDGRHRLEVLRQLGVKTVPVTVDREEAAGFRRKFGSTSRADAAEEIAWLEAEADILDSEAFDLETEADILDSEEHEDAFNPDQPRDESGRFASNGGTRGSKNREKAKAKRSRASDLRAKAAEKRSKLREEQAVRRAEKLAAAKAKLSGKSKPKTKEVEQDQDRITEVDIDDLVETPAAPAPKGFESGQKTRENLASALEGYQPGQRGAPKGSFNEEEFVSAAARIRTSEGMATLRQQGTELLAQYGLVSRDVTEGRAYVDQAFSERADSWNARGIHAAVSGSIGLGTEVSQALERFGQGERSVTPVEAMRTYIHESLHGASPLGKDAYANQGAVVEEVSTEVAARRIVGDNFALSTYKSRYSDPDGYESSSYQRQINETRVIIEKELGGDKNEAYEILTKASFHFKRGSYATIDSPERSVRKWAESIWRSGGRDYDEAAVKRLENKLNKLR